MTRGILFQPDMVRQIRDKKKRQTRRIMKVQPPTSQHVLSLCVSSTAKDTEGKHRWIIPDGSQGTEFFTCPYSVGDTLIVREAWRTEKEYDPYKPRDLPGFHRTWFEADGPAPPEFGRYRHARFMLLHSARLHLAVSAVRVERLQDITEADAIEEGFASRAAFLSRWDELNGPGNPYVWVISWT